MKNLLKGDCSKWRSIYEEHTSSILSKSFSVTQEEYLSKIRVMSSSKDISLYDNFEEEFKDIIAKAEENGFKRTSYHMTLLSLIYKEFSLERKVITEIPTGCGKSWILSILAACIKKSLDCSVLVVTMTEFLAQFSEEHYGVFHGLTYNNTKDAFISYSKFMSIVDKLSEPTVVLIDECDYFFFEETLYEMEATSVSRRIQYKMASVSYPMVSSIIGATGTLDRQYGEASLRRQLDKVSFLRAPTIDNSRVEEKYS